MKRVMLAAMIALLAGATSYAQQSPSDAPATKEDILKYLDFLHSKEMVQKVVDAMSKPMRQMVHEQFLKDKDKLPPDFEERINKMNDEFMKSFPWDEIIQLSVPVYQKHFSKGDIDALVAFYSGPTGQKVLREMPAISAEVMEAMMPLLRKQMEALHESVQQQIAQMINETKGAKPPASPN